MVGGRIQVIRLNSLSIRSINLKAIQSDIDSSEFGDSVSQCLICVYAATWIRLVLYLHGEPELSHGFNVVICFSFRLFGN